MSGPLSGTRIVEFAGIGPGPFCAMMLSDMGAEVIRIDRKRPVSDAENEQARRDITLRGRRTIALDLKKPEGLEIALSLIESADALLEGFRPGVMERLGLGPDVCLGRNPRLVYGRMTGWGQDGPLAQYAGHDINYIAISGALHAIGPRERPMPPLNLIGDYGGGAVMLAFGIACGLFEATRSGQGQVIDAAMSDGAALLSSLFYTLKAWGQQTNHREDNLLDGGAHFYGSYACKDGRHIAIGAIEPQFYALLLKLIGADADAFTAQMDRSKWPKLTTRLADIFLTKTRAEWTALLGETDACFAPILDWDEAPAHPHNVARGVFETHDGLVQPSPAPRFSRTPAAIHSAPATYAQHSAQVLAGLGYTAEQAAALREEGVID